MFDLAVSTILLSSVAAAAPQATPPRHATVAKAPHRRTVDLRGRLEGRKWKEGRTTFYADRYIRLVAQVRHGKVVSVTPVNLTGRPLTVNSQRGRPQGRRPCIICYNLDQPLASTCIEVPCWMIPILKPILNPRTT